MRKKQAPPTKQNHFNQSNNRNKKADNLNVAQRQAIIRQIFSMQSYNESPDAPVALACITVRPDGRTDTLLINIEPEHVPIIIDAHDKTRQKMLEFFKDTRTNGATIHYLKKKVRATD
jgi:hypothetical protein